MSEDEVSIKGSMTEDISEVLARIENRLDSVEHQMAETAAAAKLMGDEVDKGATKAKRGMDGAGRAAEKAGPKIKKAGDDALGAGGKAEVAGEGFERLGNKMKKAGKEGGDFNFVLKGLRYATIATGVYALAGAVSALGAAGAIGIAHVAPLVLNLLNLGPAALTGVLAMATLKVSAAQLQKPLNQIKTEFSGLGKEVAGGGLRSGVQALANDLRPLSKVSGSGLRLFGADLGGAARQAGTFISSTRALNQVSDIFSGLTGVLNPALRGIIALLPALLSLILAIIPSTQAMARSFERTAKGLSAWIQMETANGNITRWLMTAWAALHTAGLAVWNVVVALFNIFRIAYGATTDFGSGMLTLTQRFRDWTTSAQGQAAITGYFERALPVIRQLGSLLGTAAGMLLHIAGGANIGPLLGQIQSQLLPAIGLLLNHLTAIGGVGPGIVTLFSNVARILASLPFSGFSLLIGALVHITQALMWLQQNVPGINILISTMLGIWLGFKVISAIINGIGSALLVVGKLMEAWEFLTGVFETLGIAGLIAMDSIAAGAATAGAALEAAFITSPIGWIILAVVALVVAIVILWKKAAWFRDAVKAVWAAILAAAKAVWSALVTAWNATINALMVALRAIGGFFASVWRVIVDVAKVIWAVLVIYWKIIWTVISTYVKIYFDIIKFIIQTAIYIIVGIITLILIAAKAVWQGIAFVAEWLWNTILLPIFRDIGIVASALWSGIKIAAQFCWNLIATGAQWLWNTILAPIFNFIRMVALAVWSGISTAAQFAWGLISAGASAVWNGFLHPIFSAIASVGTSIWHAIVGAASVAWAGLKAAWSGVSGFFGAIFHGIASVASSVWNGIKVAASAVANVVKGVWNAITGAAKGVWNFVAHGWNSIPSFHVPDWIPVIGGKTFSLPKLPTLYTGGPTPGGPAMVGEHGPELLVRGGRVSGVLGADGPTIADLPRGGYVVPNVETITHGMAKPIPGPIAAAVAASAPPPPSDSGSRDRELLAAIRELTGAVRHQRPPIVASGGGDVHGKVLEALRDHDREERARKRYDYTAGRG